MVSKCTNQFDHHDKTLVPKTETRVRFPLLLKNFWTTLNAQFFFYTFRLNLFNGGYYLQRNLRSSQREAISWGVQPERLINLVNLGLGGFSLL